MPSDMTGLAKMMQWIGRFYVPFFNLLAPALTGLAYTHYQLGRLAKLRQTAGLRIED